MGRRRQEWLRGREPRPEVGPPGGPLTELTGDVQRIGWNAAQELLDYAAAHGNNIAAIVLNPIDQRPQVPTADASADFLRAIEEVRERWGVILFLDDVRHGLRLHPEGSHRLLGLEPDLIALGKALGNGHSLSALLGTDDLRRSARKILFTSTYMFEAPPMAATIATLDI
ncbi:MAG: glutamate-1-semialdehyde 2,1-aminomutase [Candidatus Poriferisodalaceae bacterium]